MYLNTIIHLSHCVLKFLFIEAHTHVSFYWKCCCQAGPSRADRSLQCVIEVMHTFNSHGILEQCKLSQKHDCVGMTTRIHNGVKVLELMFGSSRESTDMQLAVVSLKLTSDLACLCMLTGHPDDDMPQGGAWLKRTEAIKNRLSTKPCILAGRSVCEPHLDLNEPNPASSYASICHEHFTCVWLQNTRLQMCMSVTYGALLQSVLICMSQATWSISPLNMMEMVSRSACLQRKKREAFH